MSQMRTVGDAVRADVRLAWRRLTTNPSFSLACVLTLALAVGANVAIFALVKRVVVNPLPYPASDRVITLDHRSALEDFRSGEGMTPGLFMYYQERARSLGALSIYRTQDLTLTGVGEPERIRTTRATVGLLDVLRVPPAQGRWFIADEGRPGGPQVAVISDRLRQARFDRAATVVGRTIALNGVPTEIVGVMPASYAFPDAAVDVWLPQQISAATPFGTFSHAGVARLRDGATLEEARRELTALIGGLPQAYPGLPIVETITNRFKLVSAAVTLKEATVGRVDRVLWILLGAVGVVLIIACANLMNLFLVRGESQQREVAIRLALGASRGALFRFFLIESGLLALTGTSGALLLGWWALRLLPVYAPPTLPRMTEVGVDAMTAMVAVALAVSIAVLFAAVQMWSRGPLVSKLVDEGRGNTAGRHTHRLRQTLMSAQIALAFVLLVTSVLLVRSYQHLRAVDPGFDPISAITFRVALPPADYQSREAAVVAHRRILEGLAVLPGVEAASAASCLPLADEGYCFGNMLQVRGRVSDSTVPPPPVVFRAVAPDLTQALGLQLKQGRSIEAGDLDRQEPVVVVNEALVRAYFRGEEVLGSYLAPAVGLVSDGRAAAPTWWRIVGVVSNTPVLALAEPEPLPMLYMPMTIAGGPGLPPLAGPNVATMSYVLRTAGEPAAVLRGARAAVADVDKRLAVSQVRTLQETLDRAAAQTTFAMMLLLIAAGAALILGMVGVYGGMSYIVAQRTREIGVYMALGADPQRVVTMILRQGQLIAALGVGVGIVAAIVAGRLVEAMLYDVSPRDPLVFAATAAGLLGIALLACWLPGRRAARVDPIDALRA